MYTYQRLKLRQLTKREKKAYEPLFHPALPQTTLTSEDAVAYGVTVQKNPVALLLATPLDKDTWDIQSLYVEPSHRHKKIATHLLQHFEKEMLQRNALVMTMTYPQKDIRMMDSFLEKMGWEGRKAIALECFFEDVCDFNPSWFKKEYPLPERFKLGLFADLTDQEVTGLKEKVKRAVPAFSDPFKEKTFEKDSSLVLTEGEEIIGWMITRKDKGVLNFDCLYIDYEYQNKSYAMTLLIKSIQLSQKIHQKGRFLVNFNQVRMQWIRTIRKRLIPFASKVTLYHQAWKKIA